MKYLSWPYVFLLTHHSLFISSIKMTEGEALKREDFSYYDQLKVRLDLVLTFTELGEYRMRSITTSSNLKCRFQTPANRLFHSLFCRTY